MDRQRGRDFNRPRMCFISPVSCFLFSSLGILVLPRTLFYPTLFHYFSTPAAAFSQAFPPVCLTAASSVISYHQLFLLLHVVSLSLRFVKETIMVRREEKLVSILPVSARHSMVSVYSSPHGGEQGEWTERSPRPS